MFTKKLFYNVFNNCSSKRNIIHCSHYYNKGELFQNIYSNKNKLNTKPILFYSSKSEFTDDIELQEISKKIKSDFENQNQNKKTDLPDKFDVSNSEEENNEKLDEDNIHEELKYEALDVKNTSELWKRLSAVNLETFSEAPQKIIYDFAEEIENRNQGLENEIEIKKKPDPYAHLQRGERGVFDVEDLVYVLRQQNARDIAVIKVSPELKYCEHFVIVSCESMRHLNSLTEVVKKVHKRKKRSNDRFINAEGKGSKWVAIDMDNIVLHIMLPKERKSVDLETLWCVGHKFDDKSQTSLLNELKLIH